MWDELTVLYETKPKRLPIFINIRKILKKIKFVL